VSDNEGARAELAKREAQDVVDRAAAAGLEEELRVARGAAEAADARLVAAVVDAAIEKSKSFELADLRAAAESEVERCHAHTAALLQKYANAWSLVNVGLGVIAGLRQRLAASEGAAALHRTQLAAAQEDLQARTDELSAARAAFAQLQQDGEESRARVAELLEEEEQENEAVQGAMVGVLVSAKVGLSAQGTQLSNISAVLSNLIGLVSGLQAGHGELSTVVTHGLLEHQPGAPAAAAAATAAAAAAAAAMDDEAGGASANASEAPPPRFLVPHDPT
jgi:hypothetical protein